MKKVLSAGLLAAIWSTGAQAATVFGVDERNNLVRFDSASPGVTQSSVKITGAGADASFQALDFRPLNGVLYGLTADNVIYTINTLTGAATAASGVLNLMGSSFAFDFNPTIDRLRIVSNTNQNYVFNPNDGSLTPATDVFYPGTDPNAGRDPGVTAAAYTQGPGLSGLGGTTQLYSIDTDADRLVTQANSAGTLGTVGSLGVDLGSRTSFDISGSDALVFNDRTLYRVDLGTGALSAIGNTDRNLFGIAIAPVPEPATWATMILGFGLIGYAMRRRPAVRARVRFA